MYIDGMGVAILFEDNKKEISLSAEIVESEIVFYAEKNGSNEQFNSFEEALKSYLQLAAK